MKKLFVIGLLVLTTGCSKRVPLSETFSGQGLKVGSVSISMAELAEEREDRAQRIELDSQLKRQTEEVLAQHKLLNPESPVVMQIHIDEFRLRHGATRFFTGVLSGSDKIMATLTVKDSSRIIISKPIKASGGNGNPFAISSQSRGSNLINGIAKLAVASLLRDSVQVAPPPAGVGQSSAITQPSTASVPAGGGR